MGASPDKGSHEGGMNHEAEKRVPDRGKSTAQGLEGARTWPVAKYKAVQCGWRVERTRVGVVRTRLGAGGQLLGNQGEDVPHSPEGPREAEEGLEGGESVTRSDVPRDLTQGTTWKTDFHTNTLSPPQGVSRSFLNKFQGSVLGSSPQSHGGKGSRRSVVRRML